MNGEANCDGWIPNENDVNSGFGHYGSCCFELDIWEANTISTVFTNHPCDVSGQYRCEGVECGDNKSDNRYDGVCDKDGCDFNHCRMGDPTYYGPGSSFKVDSTKPLTLVTQFITSDGTDTGDLTEMRRIYVQDGKVIANNVANVPGNLGINHFLICPKPNFQNLFFQECSNGILLTNQCVMNRRRYLVTLMTILKREE